ncbi:MAG: Choice-of-anchor protein, partial [Bacteroidota bacterium]|nr:Choice-of-anchor protein [Bacteroidota bacterium]
DIKLQGANPSEFSLPPNLKINIPPDSVYYLPVKFKPAIPGNLSAELVITSNSDPDSTFTLNISGRKDSVELGFDAMEINFGAVDYSSIKDTTILLRNIGTIATGFKINSLTNFNATDIIGQYYIGSGNSAVLLIKYKGPVQSGTFTDIMEITDSLCGRTIRVPLKINIDTKASAIIQVTNVEGKPGDLVEIPIILKNPKNLAIAGITKIQFDLSFNATLLAPVSEQLWGESGGIITVPIEFNSTDKEGEVYRFKPIAGLGNTESTELKISKINTFGGTAPISSIDGSFKLLGICREGGSRLYNPFGRAEFLLIPNPASDEVKVEVNLIEEGNSVVEIYNTSGALCASFVFDGSVTGKQERTIDLCGFSGGLYFAKFKTPTYFEVKKFVIIK